MIRGQNNPKVRFGGHCQLPESYGIHASNGILFNHTSRRRGLELVELRSRDASSRVRRLSGC